MYEGLLIGAFAGVLVSAGFWLLVLNHIVGLFVRSADADRRERAVLMERLSIRTAAPGAEAAAQVRVARPTPKPTSEMSDEDYRRAHRHVQPMGL